jgi:ankyrin repeat protein
MLTSLDILENNRRYLIAACQRNDQSAVHDLLDKGALPKARDDWDNQTALMIAAEKGNWYIVHLLVDGNPARTPMGCNVDAEDKRGRTALMYASWKGHPDVVKTLLIPRVAREPAGRQRQCQG